MIRTTFHVAKSASHLLLILVPLVVFVGGRFVPATSERGPSFRQPTAWSGRPAGWLGSNRRGYDFVPTLLRAVQPSFGLALIGTVAVLAGALGWGLIEGYNRRAEMVLAATGLAMLALPELAILGAVRSAFRSDLPLSTLVLNLITNISVLATLAILMLPGASRVLAARVQYVAGSKYVQRTRSYGAGTFDILWREILPHLGTDLALLAASILPRLIYLEAALSFIGLGYRGIDGLGQVLIDCRENVQNSVAQTQLLATTCVLIWVCLWPRLVIGLFPSLEAEFQ